MVFSRTVKLIYEGREIFRGEKGSLVTKESFTIEPVESDMEDRGLVELQYFDNLQIPAEVETGILSTEEAHQKTGISIRDLRFLAKRGIILAKKQRGRWKINRQSLEDYVDRMR